MSASLGIETLPFIDTSGEIRTTENLYLAKIHDSVLKARSFARQGNIALTKEFLERANYNADMLSQTSEDMQDLSSEEVLAALNYSPLMMNGIANNAFRNGITKAVNHIRFHFSQLSDDAIIKNMDEAKACADALKTTVAKFIGKEVAGIIKNIVKDRGLNVDAQLGRVSLGQLTRQLAQHARAGVMNLRSRGVAPAAKAMPKALIH